MEINTKITLLMFNKEEKYELDRKHIVDSRL